MKCWFRNSLTPAVCHESSPNYRDAFFQRADLSIRESLAWQNYIVMDLASFYYLLRGNRKI
uniref:Putative ovule protein n=1 Tax=Solanum chacoense TaxID=4108 RepID=A0A0V0HKU2_SOLCH